MPRKAEYVQSWPPARICLGGFVPIYAINDRAPLIADGAYVHPDAVVIGSVTIGAGASVWPAAVLRGDYGEITIGARTSVQDGTVIHATEELPTRVGAECVIGHLAHLEGCIVEDRSLIGSGATVLHLAVVRSGALVGAGALVPPRMEVPGGQQAVGVPAKLRDGSDSSLAISEAVRRYVDNGANYVQSLRRIG
jgi:carbonic anhydrase/acetyltransferase-like protein (isoleucine patch superfamily)